MDKVKTAVKCAGVAATYLLLLMFSKLLEFWIFTSKVTYEEIAKPNMELGSYAGELSVYLPLWLGNLPGASDYTAAVSADPWQRFPDPERKICITMSSDVCGNVPFAGGCADRGGHRSLLCKTGYSLVDAAF